MRDILLRLDDSFAFSSNGRFELLANEHVPYTNLGAADVDQALRRGIERAEGVVSVVGRVGSGKSSLIAAVADSLHEGFVPLRVTVIGVEAANPVAFVRHAITSVRDLPATALSRHERQALERAEASGRTASRSCELRVGFRISGGHVLTAGVLADLKTTAGEELTRATDPAEAIAGLQRLLDTFWKVERCPVLIVEDTDHWVSDRDTADGFLRPDRSRVHEPRRRHGHRHTERLHAPRRLPPAARSPHN